MAVAVEPMQLEDLPEILVIEKLSFPVPWSKQAFLYELLNNEYALYLVARENHEVCGYIGMWRIIDEGHITNLAVHPAYRRRGIGRLLLKALIQKGKKHGLRRLTLEVRRSNLAAQRLYMEFGFVQVGVRPRYYQDNQEDALIMWKELE
ncbi:MAG: ribosomal protein S18-alanine N-acetyltransferase [Firmicutes bacterium]|nr:ribosomal protein S18-alanine N-acetyltransferase [Bacillota bacterium]